MTVTLIGGPFDGEARETDPSRAYRVIVRRDGEYDHHLYAPTIGRPGELHYRGVVGRDDKPEKP